MSRLGHTIHAAWSVACLALLALMIGARWLQYSWLAGPRVDHLLRDVLVFDQQAFVWPWAYSSIELRSLLLAAAVLVVGLHRRLPGQFVRRVGGQWHLTPLAVSAALGLMVWLSYLFDLNPTVAVVCGTSLILAWITEGSRVARILPPVVTYVLWSGFFACAVTAGGDLFDRIAIGTWAAVMLVTHRYLAPRTQRRDLALVRVLAVMPMNVLPAVLPLVFPLHGGTLLGKGMAYSFCELPDGRLYAAVPVCDSVRSSYDDCRDGSLVEYDQASLQPVASHHFFSPTFYGRLELLVCLDDEIQAVVQRAVYQGRPVVQGVLAFPVASPASFSFLSADAGIGAMIAYDRAHDALFYSGEFDNPVVRYDRRTKEFDDTTGRELERRWFEPITLKPFNGSLTLHTDSIHPGRNRLYLADWMQGRSAYAVDLTTRHVVARYAIGSGGAMGVSVDPERDRLFVSSMWGLEVIDLATDTVIARKRTGLGNRPVVVDAARNRLYLSSMVEGKIRILDRDTFDVLGQIPVGLGSRYPLLSHDGRRLFASSTSAHFYWDADGLVPAR